MPNIAVLDTSVYANDVNKPTDGAKVLADFQNIVSEVNLKETRITNLESNAMNIAGLKTFTSGITVTTSPITASSGIRMTDGGASQLNVAFTTAFASITKAGIAVGSDTNKPGLYFNGTKWQLSNDGTTFNNIVDASGVTVSQVRQTVLTGGCDANGYANFLSAGAGLSVTFSASGGSPVVISFSNGYGSTGNVDVLASITTNQTFSSLTNTTTNYLYADTAAGVLTYSFSVLQPVYDVKAPSAPATDQHWFDLTTMQMKRWSGAAWVVFTRVFVGEAVTAGGVVTSVVTYALRGETQVEQTSLAVTTAYVLNHNLGTNTRVVPMAYMRCLTTDGGYAAGDKIYGTWGDSNGSSSPFTYAITGRNTLNFATGSGTIFFGANKTTTTGFAPTPANWAAGMYIRRGF